ncbi:MULTISPECIES: hypothetical protein [unclassified Saccharothrix]|uniref:hypothetical protein n=1 Tax=unclassified Saccharothrix TaxID=2593673 RepID=UPI00307F6926
MTVTGSKPYNDVVGEMPRDLVVLMVEVMDLARGEALFVPAAGLGSTVWCCWPYEPPYRLGHQHAAAVEWLESNGLVYLEHDHVRLDEDNEPMEVDAVSLTDNGREGYEMLIARLHDDD